ncbi:MAG: SpoIIE family protein phosphatase [Drouetiella hepatica Uher 2000/2452]|jgi:sigma-B regulation protein RsbU (phosphoserine phosphatase)|uniref:SpoIIE family protein phosphatase n=1 Tax=Drouetiella hepatica Uher 2000/2452 TaxID=904376 RepID=A0A951Q5R8_9CYAN|nr:SpoIIE family protein phosphatase [Drouetiella hepatica Uher 2000/2452]
MVQILIVDDDPVIRMILRKTLQAQGYQVAVAESGEECILQAKALRPALIICDWLMAGITGLEVCRQIKADPDLSSIFFILLTSRSGVVDRVIGLDAGADDFLPKPIEVHELQARVRSGLRLHQSAQDLQQLVQDLQTQKQLLETELAEASAYVRSLLPHPLTGKVSTTYRFLPSSQLGGDCFDYFWLDPDFLAIYLLDVSGHGLGSALLSVTVQNMLRSQSLPSANFYQPSNVLRSLNEIFDMDEHHSRYFTIWYGVYNQQKRQLVYASAGHPPAVLMSAQVSSSADIQLLKTRGMPIGMLTESKYPSDFCEVRPDDTLYLFSDGIYEVAQSDEVPWNLNEFIQLLSQMHGSQPDPLDPIIQAMQSFSGKGSFEDDCSLLQVKFG